LETVARNILSSLKKKEAAFDSLEAETDKKKEQNRELKRRIEAVNPERFV
jgi:hypothetical protein